MVTRKLGAALAAGCTVVVSCFDLQLVLLEPETDSNTAQSPPGDTLLRSRDR